LLWDDLAGRKNVSMTNRPDLEQAKAYILEHLSQGLPDGLRYHAIQHTFEDVLPAAERLAELAGLSEEERLLLHTAALYHDIGYIEAYDQNEAIAARIAQETLPRFGYQPGQIGIIAQAILATRFPQSPKTYLESLLCDADLDTLGRDDYFDTGRDLWQELKERGRELSRREWHERQIKLLSEHRYFTEVAQKLRSEGQQRNLEELRRRLANL
jgi:predicted metal-dependent HD superfamily phosphohydrolase